MITISPDSLSFFLAILSVIGVIFAVYLYFRNPQIRSDKDISKLQSDVESIKAELLEVKEKHLYEVQEDMKALSKNIQDLSTTVTKLSTIIDERMPRYNNGNGNGN